MMASEQWQISAPGKVIKGLVSHWPRVTDCGISTYKLDGLKRGDEDAASSKAAFTFIILLLWRMVYSHWSSIWYSSQCNIWHGIWSHVISSCIPTLSFNLLLILIIITRLAAAARFRVLKDGFEQVNRRTLSWFFDNGSWQLLTGKYKLSRSRAILHTVLWWSFVSTYHTNNGYFPGDGYWSASCP